MLPDAFLKRDATHGTRELLSAAIVDSGSGYCSQSELPVQPGRTTGVEERYRY